MPGKVDLQGPKLEQGWGKILFQLILLLTLLFDSTDKRALVYIGNIKLLHKE